MYYGGIASIASLVLVTIFLIILFIKLKRKLYKKINEDF
jgi:hypothetical protein